MKFLSFTALLVLASVPALAQNAGNPLPAGAQEPAALTTEDRQKLLQTLKEAGFTQIDIGEAAYRVRARTGDGKQVTMYVNPPPATGDRSPVAADPPQLIEPENAFETDSIRTAGPRIPAHNAGATIEGYGAN